LKVLVVEDNYYTRDIITRRLTRNGYQVVAAINGARCLELAHAERPDLILLDMRLPDLSGLQVTQQLKAEPDTSRIPIIAMTAYQVEESREQALAAGCEDYESKPLDFDRLLKKISFLLGQSRP
jgi:CheY-like chemotaxis protein